MTLCKLVRVRYDVFGAVRYARGVGVWDILRASVLRAAVIRWVLPTTNRKREGTLNKLEPYPRRVDHEPLPKCWDCDDLFVSKSLRPSPRERQSTFYLAHFLSILNHHMPVDS